MVGALFQRLTGKKLVDYVSDLLIKPRENVNLDFLKDKDNSIQVILTFRNHKFNVTRNLNLILSK